MAKRTLVLFSSFFGWDIPSGGANFSRDIVREWLLRGYRVHVFCARLSKYHLSDLEVFERSGLLVLDGMIDPEETGFGHRLNEVLAKNVRERIKQIQPDEIHIHNFQGFLSGLVEAVSTEIPTTYVALDFGMECITWYLFDGTKNPCSGPEKKKCLECGKRVGRFRFRDGPFHFFGLVKRFLKVKGEPGHRSYFSRPVQRYWHGEAANSLEIMGKLLREFSRIIAPSPPVYEQIVRRRGNSTNVLQLLYPISPNRILTNKNSSPYVNPTEKKEMLNLIFLGHAHPIKGWDFFLKVLETLPDGLALEVRDLGGNIDQFNNSSIRTKRYLKESYRAKASDLLENIQASDAILVPSLWHENTPLVVIEALANSRPVLASNQRGIAHLIQHRQNGFLLGPGNIEEWKAILIELSRDPAIARSMRARCRYSRTTADFVNDLEELNL